MNVSAVNEVNEQDGLISVAMAEHQTGIELEKLKQKITSNAAEYGEEVDVIVDVSKVKTSDEAANTVARSFFKDLPFKHMAVYGGNRAVNVGIKLILNLFISMGVGEVKLFKTEVKARAWLESVR